MKDVPNHQTFQSKNVCFENLKNIGKLVGICVVIFPEHQVMADQPRPTRKRKISYVSKEITPIKIGPIMHEKVKLRVIPTVFFRNI